MVRWWQKEVERLAQEYAKVRAKVPNNERIRMDESFADRVVDHNGKADKEEREKAGSEIDPSQGAGCPGLALTGPGRVKVSGVPEGGTLNVTVPAGQSIRAQIPPGRTLQISVQS